MECVVEMGRDDRNINLFCHPLGRELRGRFAQSNAGPLKPGLRPLPDMPGIRVAIDVKERRVRIFDPLAKDVRKAKKIEAIQKESGEPGKPCEDETLDNLSERQIQHWLWWLNRVVEVGDAERVTGSLVPSTGRIGRGGDFLLPDEQDTYVVAHT